MNRLARLGISAVLFICWLSSEALGQDDRSSASDNNSGSAKAEIDWVDSLEEAKRISAQDGRPVIAYFTFNTCVWCKRLEDACFYQPEVVELSRRFVWVKVNRDNTPEIPLQFNVSAYPSLLTLGREDENVYRFQGFRTEPDFISDLEKALDRYSRYADEKEWFIAEPRPEKISEVGVVTSLPAPNDQVPSGMTQVGNQWWIAQGDLQRVDPESGEVLKTINLPGSVCDLCTDGQLIYAATFSWTAGGPIYVIDPVSGDVVREVVTESNKANRASGAKGVAWKDGDLYILEGMRGQIRRVDVESGEILETIDTGLTWLSGFDFDGEHFVIGSRENLFLIHPDDGTTVREFVVNYPIRSVAASSDGGVWVMEQPIFGFGRKHERIQVWPQQTKVYKWALPDQ